MSISKEEFCKIETMLTGEELNYVEQLKYKSFTGLELLEYLNDFYELYNDSKQSHALQLQQTGVSGRSEQLCGNLDENYNCKNMCLTHCIDGNKFYK